MYLLKGLSFNVIPVGYSFEGRKNDTQEVDVYKSVSNFRDEWHLCKNFNSKRLSTWINGRDIFRKCGNFSNVRRHDNIINIFL